jgi:3',5'-cyclic AMP phosphodiesterase CpdA
VKIVAAGDIASCEEAGDSATAALIAGLDDDIIVAILGDSVYPSGSDATYAECYDPIWGAWLDRTRPALGNHDVGADGGAAYHAYFGDRAGPSDVGWYSYDIGAWHAIVLDSNCDLVGCGPGTAQHDWLLADLAASDTTCTLAYWHHPRFTSGPHGDDLATAPFWDALYDAGADVILDGHDHLYERFAPQNPDGSPDERGIRQFTVGTGGKQLYPPVRIAPNSEGIVSTFGVLELTLHADSYDWRFLSVDGEVPDAGTADCH